MTILMNLWKLVDGVLDVVIDVGWNLIAGADHVDHVCFRTFDWLVDS
jgi:hypothetical protein